MKRKSNWKWFVPSWNGDLRLEPAPGDLKRTRLSIVDPTLHEKEVLAALSPLFVQKKWLKEPLHGTDITQDVLLDAPLEVVGPLFIAALKPGPAVLTAVRFSGGEVEVVEHKPVAPPVLAETTAVATTVAMEEKTEDKLAEVANKKDVKAAATVSRPTPSCPDCIPGSIAPAREVLLSFLTSEQHETWKKGRYVVAQGNLTGHRYIIAHRHSKIAQKNTRIAWDADDCATLHFHNSALPPEEEVLSAMLVLQHREHWLRNQATCLIDGGDGLGDFRRFHHVFDNPFGTIMDGVPDANLTCSVGAYAMFLAEAVVSLR
jgi:hypothetical protein